MKKLSYSFQKTASTILSEAGLEPPYNFLIAYSGGLDSTALLTLMHRWRTEAQHIHIRAIHINHQLQEDARHWQSMCEAYCQELQINLSVFCVNVKKNKNGLEAAAREARYSVFKNEIRENEILLTAHHLNDQAETLMLRLLRGTGVEGAAAMSSFKGFHSGFLMRPLLSVSREALDRYAQSEKLTWVDDPSNNESQFDRNYLRNEIFPKLAERWPSFQLSLARFAQNAAENTNLLQDYMQADVEACIKGKTLDIPALLRQDMKKQKHILRRWLKLQAFDLPSERQLTEIFKLIHARDDAAPIVNWGSYEIRRYQAVLYAMHQQQIFSANTSFHWNIKEPLIVQGAGTLKAVGNKAEGGQQELLVKFRRGGEKCRIARRNNTQSLKKLMQESGIPPWLRDRWPLIYKNNEIIAVPEIFSNLDDVEFKWLRD